jgi:hypothetical protein
MTYSTMKENTIKNATPESFKGLKALWISDNTKQKEPYNWTIPTLTLKTF